MKKKEEITESQTKSQIIATQHQKALDSMKESYQQQYNQWKKQIDEFENENLSLKNKLNSLTVKLNEEEFRKKIGDQNYVSL